jgi:formylglycine-generating enzyme required for sulfatase activity
MKQAIPAILASILLSPSASAQCVGDVAVDSRVDGGDLGVLLANWGPVTSTALSRACDFDSNGQIDGADLGALLADWGECSESVRVPIWATLVEATPDPAIVTDPALRSAIRATGLAWRVRDTATQVEMLLVPPGVFQMGCMMGSEQYSCDTWEVPVHQVTLTTPFYLGRYEVTQAQWRAEMGDLPSYYYGLTKPVENVSWNRVQVFLGATGFRLPTEAEWEYACRAGTITPFHGGPGFPQGTTDDNLASLIAWLKSEGGSGAKPVGGKAANALGFHDMLGNVWEWLSDGYNDGTWQYMPGSQVDPIGSGGTAWRVMRGGCWINLTFPARTSYRSWQTPSHFSAFIGFRVARNP